MTTSNPKLPPELWYLIFTHRRNIQWNERKNRIHKLLSNTIIPCSKHRTRFTFQDYSITFFRTNHIEITITRRNNRFTINHVLYFQENLQTRFIYCPTYRIN